jgi:hypothetical protein
MVKGDRVEVPVDVGGSVAERFEIAARPAGRRVEVSNVRGTVAVAEVTRCGTPIRTARFLASPGYRYRRTPSGRSRYRVICGLITSIELLTRQYGRYAFI